MTSDVKWNKDKKVTREAICPQAKNNQNAPIIELIIKRGIEASMTLSYKVMVCSKL